ncbi:dihydroxyacetone kinase family protein [Labrys monachus]|uniref:Dihydroxyacetone kinase-like protein n=1 Tax=Labrys monachus TaxID=217067 RepID=A0ABU0F8I3_9HYPH|nr:dihydroxyacetone kinase subunit L [Labrys monachus]MDQ0390922.1 dihydroxyacetone kinase-like protein [Labrys monachus]
MDAMSSSDLGALFGAWRTTFAEQRDYLISLDGKVGDSDLGITMAKAFAAAADAVAAVTAIAPISKILITAGAAMAKAAPSTMGTLTATGFMRGGKALEGAGALGVREAALFWRAYGNGIAERGKAKVGDKTILDVIDPIARTLEGTAEAGGRLANALAAAAVAAEEALESTKSMLAQHGKAAAFQEKSVGHQDAGATVGVLMIQTMRDFAISRSDAVRSQADDQAAFGSETSGGSLS